MEHDPEHCPFIPLAAFCRLRRIRRSVSAAQTSLADLSLLATDTALGMALATPRARHADIAGALCNGAEPGLRVIRIFDRLGQWGTNLYGCGVGRG